jgi:hypothetical protein
MEQGGSADGILQVNCNNLTVVSLEILSNTHPLVLFIGSC